MPRIYEYFGLIVFFWSNEHEPVHVHIEYGDYIAIAEFFIEDGKVARFEFKKKRNAPMLPDAQLKKAKELIEAKKNDILKKWGYTKIIVEGFYSRKFIANPHPDPEGHSRTAFQTMMPFIFLLLAFTKILLMP